MVDGAFFSTMSTRRPCARASPDAGNNHAGALAADVAICGRIKGLTKPLEELPVGPVDRAVARHHQLTPPAIASSHRPASRSWRASSTVTSEAEHVDRQSGPVKAQHIGNTPRGKARVVADPSTDLPSPRHGSGTARRTRWLRPTYTPVRPPESVSGENPARSGASQLTREAVVDWGPSPRLHDERSQRTKGSKSSIWSRNPPRVVGLPRGARRGIIETVELRPPVSRRLTDGASPLGEQLPECRYILGARETHAGPTIAIGSSPTTSVRFGTAAALSSVATSSSQRLS